ncbi:MAG: hypothetical protein PF448_01665 [Bacteroidales bacterium]|jgi:hypothetical protein|nr:hypothetical protein [Bacteroidales bacterium]
MKNISLFIVLLCLVFFTSCNRHEAYDPVTAHISFVNHTDMDFDSLQLEYLGFPLATGYIVHKLSHLNAWDTTQYITCDSIDEGFGLMLYSDSLEFYTRWDYPKIIGDPVNPQVNHIVPGYYHFGIFPGDSLNSDMHIGLEYFDFSAIY